MDVSEVLFNEVAFYRLIQETQGLVVYTVTFFFKVMCETLLLLCL